MTVNNELSDNVPLVFSRKGFDSSSAGGFSPYDPETGKYMVLPIPGGSFEDYYGNKILYRDIKIKPNYFDGINADNLYDLIFCKQLGYHKKTLKLVDNNYAHFDPMLCNCQWLDDERYQAGAFGQCSASQGELRNRNAGPGTIFLFFGRFKPVSQRKNNMGFEIYEGGSYFLYGWMKVKKVISRYEDIDDEAVKKFHPHATEEYFEKSKNNTIYISDDKLFSDCDIPGCGYFPALNKKLLLTDTDHMDRPWFWRMPSCFSKPGFTPSHFSKDAKWYQCSDKDMLVVESPANRSGQEYITELSCEAEKWLRSLFG